ncbi:hypothetical protein PAXRUDRAFT_15698 [Paxillus rubicundulus Ve08.2h10]|uniref:Uncharacterized protein n=1 Tax=Paxillus rubicundulus Ve08.2h10 TaxID=930991 RepID=A0A0D0CYA1_9AGAM|nr:hypothetical protein PAXRUDRAFT_15698 [Paxillus rubicundulus Ve08.2h10]
MQGGELEHHRSKQQFLCSSKKKGTMVKSIANQEAIEQFIKKVNDARKKLNEQNDPQPCQPHTSPLEHYHIAKSSRNSKDFTAWLREQRGNHAFKDFLPHLHP